MELKITLQPKQKIAFEKSFITPAMFYGGAKGGGKSYLIRARELTRRLKYAGSRGLIVRKTHPELLANHIQKFFEEYPVTRDWYNKSEKTIYWPNGSTTAFSYLQNRDDVFTYQGREYEDISIDEITQHEEIVFKVLRTSNRTSNQKLVEQGMIPTMFLTGNPGGIGHTWVKRIFVDRQFKPEEHAEDFDFVQAFVQDNLALLKADPDYLRRLEDLPETLRKAYLNGDWNIHAGQAFSELSARTHVIDPFEFVEKIRWFAGFDHGFNHPYVFTLFAIDSAGKVYCVNHLKNRFQNAESIAKAILAVTEGCKPLYMYAGTDIWNKERDGDPSVANQLEGYGLNAKNKIYLLRANTDRVQGAAHLRDLLKLKDGEPTLRFFRNTMPIVNTISEMQFDPLKPEDVLKVNADENGDGGDDAYDSARYGLMGLLTAPKVVDSLPDDAGMKLFNEMIARKQAQDKYRQWH